MHGGGGFGRIDDLAALLNVTGGQTIAMLSMSVSGPDEERTDMQDDRMRPPKMAAIPKAERINCSWGQDGSKPWRGAKKEHVFAEADVSRGFAEDDDADDVDPMDIDQNGPVSSRWALLLPLNSLLSACWHMYQLQWQLNCSTHKHACVVSARLLYMQRFFVDWMPMSWIMAALI